MIVMSNASQTMPPTGGVRPFMGTNPIAFGFPTGTDVPFILDMATSLVARGKIISAADKGESIPLGWAVDANGKPTTDAHAALVGAVLPVGGAKGSGLSMAIDIMCGVMTGAGFGPSVRNMYEDWQNPQNVGHAFLLIGYDRVAGTFLVKNSWGGTGLPGVDTAPPSGYYDLEMAYLDAKVATGYGLVAVVFPPGF